MALVSGERQTANHVNRIGRPGRLIDLPQQVEQMRVHIGRTILPPVAEDVVQLLQAVLVVDAVPLEDDRRLLAGVDMVDLERPVAFRDGAERADRKDAGQQSQLPQYASAYGCGLPPSPGYPVSDRPSRAISDARPLLHTEQPLAPTLPRVRLMPLYQTREKPFPPVSHAELDRSLRGGMVAFAARIGTRYFARGDLAKNGSPPLFKAGYGDQPERLLDAAIMAVKVVANLQRAGLVDPGGEVGNVDGNLVGELNRFLRPADQLLSDATFQPCSRVRSTAARPQGSCTRMQPWL